MKVGSLVECINSKGLTKTKPLVEGSVYTVRELVDRITGKGILLEEVRNPIHWVTQLEFGYRVERFREVQPPMDLSFINELQTTQTA